MKYENEINAFFGLNIKAVERMGKEITLEEAQDILAKRGSSVKLNKVGVQKAVIEDSSYIENKTIYLA